MGVSRSGYYKWRKRDKSTRDLRREEVIALVSEVHKAHPSHGYRWVAAFIRVNYQQDISDNYVYKVFRFLGIKAKTKHQVHYRPRKIRDLYPNLIFTTWDTVDRPRQVIVSDMTVLKPWIFYLELTLYFDVFTKQILTWKLSERRGGREQYLDGLADVVELLRGKKEPTIIHTDQGSVYSSKAYNELIQDRAQVAVFHSFPKQKKQALCQETKTKTKNQPHNKQRKRKSQRKIKKKNKRKNKGEKA